MRLFLPLLNVAFAAGFYAQIAVGLNGSNVIGVTPASVAMGGTGVAHYNGGLDSLFKNPSLLSDLSQNEGGTSLEVGGTFMAPTLTAQSGSHSAKTSSAPNVFFPEVGVTYRINDQLTLGLGLLTYGGSATSYVDQTDLSQVSGSFKVARLIPALCYQLSKKFSMGAGPYLAYGALALNYQDEDGIASGRQPHGATGLGFQLGATVEPWERFVIGASFTSSVQLAFKDIANFDLFAQSPVANAPIQGLNVTQPMEMAAGVSVGVSSGLSLTFDYRYIDWSTSDPYRQLGWSGQSVFGVGGQYRWEKAVFRVGYNYGRSPLSDTTNESGTVNLQGHEMTAGSLSLMDVTAFPGISEHHIGLGGGYAISERLNADASFVISPTATLTRSSSLYTYKGTVSMWALSGLAAYSF